MKTSVSLSEPGIAVIKLGTRSVVLKNNHVNGQLLNRVARDVARLVSLGWKVIVVSSGAVACGKRAFDRKTTDQVYSMIGQPILMKHWSRAFARVKLVAAQALFTNQMLEKAGPRRDSSIAGLIQLLNDGCVPIVNELDGVTTAELRKVLGGGDNDHPARLIAQAVDAKLLVFLTSTWGVEQENGEHRPIIGHLCPDDDWIFNTLENRPGEESNGGMKSKLTEAMIFSAGGGYAVITNFRERQPLFRFVNGASFGTIISFTLC